MTEEIERGRKNIQRHNGQKHPKFDERYEPTHLKCSRNSKQDEFKDIHIEIQSTIKRQRILKATRQKLLTTYKGSSRRLTADFSLEITEARKHWDHIFKVLKEKKHCQPRIIYLVRTIL